MDDKEPRSYVRARVQEFAADLRWTGTLTPKERLRGPCGPALEKEPLDRGLWLLRDLFVRQESWSRVAMKPLTNNTECNAALRPWGCSAKRACDIAVSTFLVLLLLPLFGTIAVLIRLDSPGPVLFRHRRVGKGGKEFVLWKFRSMRSDVPLYQPSPTSAADRRLTRVGRVIRRFSLDELPQLLNVMAGDMSLVGPRPEMPFIVFGYSEIERARLGAKPGITGLWQISPARALPIHKNLQYDFHYIQHQNMFLDCAILLRTITSVIHGIGAV
jgi:lipopolysaccharide/colanic/teichoic acid biosynthesis glycosyltransferase